MKTINEIYESILGDPTTAKSRLKNAIAEWDNNPFNSLIKIIVLSSGMSAKGQGNFRRVMDKLADKYPHFTCYIPTEIRCELQVSSGKKLAKDVFKWFPTDKKEHDFHFAMAYRIMEVSFPQVPDFMRGKITYAKDDFSVIGADKNGNDIIAGTFGANTKIVVYKDLICMWVDGHTKLSIRFLTEPTRSNSRPTRE